MAPQKKRVVTIGGGTGSFMLLSGLKEYDVELSAVVAMSDDGGSTGALRDELGVLPPGDIRQCLIALSDAPELFRKLLGYRFESGKLRGHNFGNLFLSALEKITGSFEDAVDEAAALVHASGKVIPVTLDNARLTMKLTNGKMLTGQHAISESRLIQRLGYRIFSYTSSVHANPRALEAIRRADVVTIGPGDHFGSIQPNLLIPGIARALRATRAKIVYIPNLTNKKGQTISYSTVDYLSEIQQYLKERSIDYMIVNTRQPSERLMKKYQRQEGAGFWVTHATRPAIKTAVLKGNYLSSKKVTYSESDVLASRRSFIRHDGAKLAKTIVSLS